MSTVYVVGIPRSVSAPVKIGYSTEVEERLRDLRRGAQMPLRVAGMVGDASRLEVLTMFEGDQSLERRLHRAFAERRVGGEWFYLGNSSKAVERIRAVVMDVDEPDVDDPEPAPPVEAPQLPMDSPATLSTEEWTAYLQSRRPQRQIERRQAGGRAKAAHITDLVQTLFEAIEDHGRREGLRDLFPEVFCKCPGCGFKVDK